MTKKDLIDLLEKWDDDYELHFFTPNGGTIVEWEIDSFEEPVDANEIWVNLRGL